MGLALCSDPAGSHFCPVFPGKVGLTSFTGHLSSLHDPEHTPTAPAGLLGQMQLKTQCNTDLNSQAHIYTESARIWSEQGLS